jgi:hypothetical protein
MSDMNNQAGPDGSSSVSALGLRWAALRGMLASPLIEAEEQRSLREDLVRELQTIERDFAALPARNTTEISAKIDVAKTVLRQGEADDQGWMVGLLESVQADLRTIGTAPALRQERPAAMHMQRRFPSAPQPNPVATLPESESPAA